MILLLKLLLIPIWIVTQLLGLMFFGWGLLGFQMGEPSSGVIGIIAFVTPTLLCGGGLLLATRRPDLAPWALGVPIVVLAGGTAILLLAIHGARP